MNCWPSFRWWNGWYYSCKWCCCICRSDVLITPKVTFGCFFLQERMFLQKQRQEQEKQLPFWYSLPSAQLINLTVIAVFSTIAVIQLQD